MRIKANAVGKKIRGRVVLTDVSLDWIGPGVFVIAGAPRSGKSTLVRMLAGIESCSEGRVETTADADEGTGYLPQDYGFHPNLTPARFLDYMAILRGVTDGRQRALMVRSALMLAGMGKLAGTRISKLSPSWRQRLAVVQSFLCDEKVLFWDEPERNLRDRDGSWLRGVVEGLARDKMVVVAARDVSAYSSLITRMLVLEGERVLVEGEPGSLEGFLDGRVWEGLVPFREWDSFKDEHAVVQAGFANGGISVQVVGTCPGPGFVNSSLSLVEAIRYIGQGGSIASGGTRL